MLHQTMMGFKALKHSILLYYPTLLLLPSSLSPLSPITPFPIPTLFRTRSTITSKTSSSLNMANNSTTQVVSVVATEHTAGSHLLRACRRWRKIRCNVARSSCATF